LIPTKALLSAVKAAKGVEETYLDKRLKGSLDKINEV